MSKHLGLILAAVLVVLALLVYTITYTVDYSQVVLVQTFGQTTQVRNGETDSGLHFKLPYPIQKVVTYDRRIHTLEDTPQELNTRRKLPVLLTLSCSWKIADAKQFNATVGSMTNAELRIRDALRTAKRGIVPKHTMGDFVNVAPGKMLQPEIEKEIYDEVRPNLLSGYGVEVVSIGIKSFTVNQRTTQAIIEAEKAERETAVKAYSSRGEALAKAIEERAKTAREYILDFARRKASGIRSEGEAAAAEYYAIFDQAPEFAIFLRSLKSLEAELAERAIILMDGSMVPAVQYFRLGPSAMWLHLGDRKNGQGPAVSPLLRPRTTTQPSTTSPAGPGERQ